MKRLLKVTGWHIQSRALSTLFSFIFFALIAQKLPSSDAQRAFFFMFSLGFFVSTLRLYVQVGSAINGSDRSSKKLSDITQGFKLLASSCLLFVPGIFITLYLNADDLQISIFATAVVMAASLDADLYRAVVNRGPSFSTTFAFGSAFTLLGIYFTASPDFKTILFWLSAQWLPTAFYNIFFTKYLRLSELTLRRSSSFVKITSLISIAFYEGVVLNAPFLGWLDINPEAGLELSLGMRVFVASLFIYPILMHISNAHILSSISANLKVSESTFFGLSLLVGGGVSGTFFIFFYEMISGNHVPQTSYLISFLYIISYSFYSTQIRFHSIGLGYSKRLFIFSAFLILYLFLFVTFSLYFSKSSLNIAILQSFFLLGCAIVIKTFQSFFSFPRKMLKD